MNKFTYQLALVAAVFITVGSVQQSESRLLTFADQVDVREFDSGGLRSKKIQQRTKIAAEHNVLGKCDCNQCDKCIRRIERKRRSGSSLVMKQEAEITDDHKVLSRKRKRGSGSSQVESLFPMIEEAGTGGKVRTHSSASFTSTYVPPQVEGINPILLLDNSAVRHLITYGWFSNSDNRSFKVNRKVLTILRGLNENFGIDCLRINPIISARKSRKLRRPTICRQYTVLKEDGTKLKIRLVKANPLGPLKGLIKKVARKASHTPDAQTSVASHKLRLMGQSYEVTIDYWGPKFEGINNLKKRKKGKIFLTLGSFDSSGRLNFGIECNEETVGNLTASLIG